MDDIDVNTIINEFINIKGWIHIGSWMENSQRLKKDKGKNKKKKIG